MCSGELRKHGIKIRLQEQPFQVLAMLLDRPGEVVAREDLRKKLWPSDTFVDFDVGLNSAIVRLRSALGDSADSPRFVETLPRRGYRFIARLDDSAPPSAHASPPGDAATIQTVKPATELSRAARKGLRLQDGRLIVFALAASLAIVVTLNPGGLRQRVLGKTGQPKIQSLAVLPLENLSGNPEQEYFADGMTDALITDLAQISTLQVISRTSVMQYKRTSKQLLQIAKELNVDAVVEGTVSRSDNRVRVTAQLIEARRDRHLWAKAYEREVTDILSLQDDVAQGITTEIQTKLRSGGRYRLTTTRSVNPAAYEAYLKGRLIWTRTSVEEAKNALPYFQQAIGIDPNYAPAYSGVSDCYRTFGIFGGMPKPEAWRKAKAAALRAVELDDTLAEAHRSLATVRLFYDWDLAESERENQRALQLNPGDAETYRVYGFLLSVGGRSSEAFALNKRAQQLDPLSPNTAVHLAINYYYARQYDEALEQAQRAIQLDPTFIQAHRWLGLAYEAKRRFPEAIAEFQLTVKLSPGNQGYLGNLARLYAAAGKRTEARRVFAQLKEQSKAAYVSPMQYALIYGALGEKDRAFAWLEKAYEERNENLVPISTAPWFDPLRSDPRFAEFERRVKAAGKPFTVRSNSSTAAKIARE